MRARVGALSAGLVALVVLPLLLSDFRTLQLATVGVYFVAILGLDLLTAQSGQISVGQGAFMAVGAYTTAILMSRHGVRDVWTIPCAAVVAGAAGLLAGLLLLRVTGRYAALATFGLAVALPGLLRHFDHFTGGSAGIGLSGRPTQSGHGAGALGLSNDRWLYALTWAIAIALFLAARAAVSSRFGRSLRAVRDSELAAVAVGVNRSLYRVLAFGLSAAYAGVAGSLLALVLAHVRPETFPLQLSLYLVAGAMIGLFGSVRGAILGALAVQFLPDVVGRLPYVEAGRAGPAAFAFGVLLVALMLLLPLVVRIGELVGQRGYRPSK